MIRLMGLVSLQPVGSLKNEAELTAAQKHLDVDKDGKIEASDLEKLRAGEKPKTENHGEDHEVSMAHNTLDDIIKNATELKAKLGNEEKNIPAWIQDHISQAQNFISQAATNYHEYESPAPSAEGMCEGEGCEEQISEKWAGDAEVEKTGEHAGKTIEQLHKELNALKKRSAAHQEKGEKVPDEIIKKERQLMFAIRAKKGWPKGKGSMDEVSPEGWEGTVKAMKKYPQIDNPWALAYYMKKKGYKSHKGE